MPQCFYKTFTFAVLLGLTLTTAARATDPPPPASQPASPIGVCTALQPEAPQAAGVPKIAVFFPCPSADDASVHVPVAAAQPVATDVVIALPPVVPVAPLPQCWRDATPDEVYRALTGQD